MLVDEAPDRMVWLASVACILILVVCGPAVGSNTWDLWVNGLGIYKTVCLSGISKMGSSEL